MGWRRPLPAARRAAAAEAAAAAGKTAASATAEAPAPEAPEAPAAQSAGGGYPHPAATADAAPCRENQHDEKRNRRRAQCNRDRAGDHPRTRADDAGADGRSEYAAENARQDAADDRNPDEQQKQQRLEIESRTA